MPSFHTGDRRSGRRSPLCERLTMIELPPIPTWDGLHPLIIHFPIALLLIAPIFILLGIMLHRKGLHFSMAALILMILGTVSLFVALKTGEAAGELAERSPQIMQVLQHHEELAETTRSIFTSLTIIFSAIILGPRLLKRSLRFVPALALHGGFLLLYMAGTLVLVNTAHNGGRLVHELGVHALMDAAPSGDAAGME
jgi:uncharacterized membrane protein